MRLVVGTIALVWTLIAVLLAITGADPRVLQLVGALWAIYGLTVGLLAGPMNLSETAAIELDNLRRAQPLKARDDFRVGLALVELYEHDLKEPGRAMAELRRLIDRYPTAQGARRLRVALASLKSERFGI